NSKKPDLDEHGPVEAGRARAVDHATVDDDDGDHLGSPRWPQARGSAAGFGVRGASLGSESSLTVPGANNCDRLFGRGTGERPGTGYSAKLSRRRTSSPNVMSSDPAFRAGRLVCSGTELFWM